MRLIVGYFGIAPETAGIKKIIRRTTYGQEIDYYSIPDKQTMPVIPGEKFRFNADLYDNEDFYEGFTREIFIEMNQQERFWELHEIMEHYWKISSGMKKKFLKEIIGILVSQVKWQMGQYEVSGLVLERNLLLIEKETEFRRKDIIKGENYPVFFTLKFFEYFEQIYIT